MLFPDFFSCASLCPAKLSEAQFFSAIEKGDVRAAACALGQGQSLEARDATGDQPLHFAVCHNQKAVAALLLDRGASVDGRVLGGRTPLWHAAGFNQPELAALLLSRGSDKHGPDDQGSTPLHIAAWNGSLETAQLLIDAGCAVGRLNASGLSPLAYAVMNGKTPLVELLLRGGADFHSKIRGGAFDGYNLLHLAAYNAGGYDASLKQSEAPYIMIRIGSGLFSLEPAECPPEIIRLLIERGVDVNSRTDDGMTALHLAVSRLWNRSIDAIHTIQGGVKVLIEKGADVNAFDKNGATPLFYLPYGFEAFEGNELVTARMLIAAGADVNRQAVIRDEKYRILDYALFYLSSKNLALLLIENGAEIRKPVGVGFFMGFSYLQWAVWENDTVLTEFFFKRGLDPNQPLPGDDFRMRSGYAPLHLAAEQGWADMVRLLLSCGADKNALITLGENMDKKPVDLARTDETKKLLE